MHKINAQNLLHEKVKIIAQDLLKSSKKSHNWAHTMRVVNLCRHIGSKEGADMDVLLSAAYFHDIGRDIQDSSRGIICHAKKGAEIAMPIIENLPFLTKQKENIIHCIRSHRFRGDHTPQTIEAKVLYDSDKIDAIGAVGIARAFLFAGELGAQLHNPDIKIEDTVSYSYDDTGYREYKVKLSKIKDRLLTNEGKKIGSERHSFMENFFTQFIKEYKGDY